MKRSPFTPLVLAGLALVTFSAAESGPHGQRSGNFQRSADGGVNASGQTVTCGSAS